MAITAWSAKVVTNSICLSVNGRDLAAHRPMTPIGTSFAQQRNAEHGAEAAELLRLAHQIVFGIGQNVGHVNGFAFEQARPIDVSAARLRTALLFV